MSKTVIVGASGWLGKSALQAYLELFQNEETPTLVSRAEKLVHVSGLGIAASPRNESFFAKSWDRYIHCAFATREHYYSLGSTEYIAENKKIIREARQDILRGRPSKVLVISSGAVSRPPLASLTDPSYAVYGELKRLELETLRSAAHSVGAKFLDGRLFSATGSFMKEPVLFAIGNFIQQASTQKRIKVTSTQPTYRRYCDSVQFMKSAFHNLDNGADEKLESGGVIVEMGELAMEVCLEMGISCDIERNLSQLPVIDDYFSRSWKFEESLFRLGEEPLSLRAQIRNVIERLNQSG